MPSVDQTAAQVIRRVLSQHRVGVEQILLFGSRARGQAGPSSDWDFYVLIDGDLSFAERQHLVTEIKRELARLRIPNDVILKSAQQYHRTKSLPGHLAYDVAHEGIPLP